MNNFYSILISIPSAPIKLQIMWSTNISISAEQPLIGLICTATQNPHPPNSPCSDVNLDALDQPRRSIDLELDAHRGGHDRKLVHAGVK